MSLARRPQHVLARGLMILALTMLAATAVARLVRAKADAERVSLKVVYGDER